MDNQFPNIPENTPDNQTPENDIFKEQTVSGTESAEPFFSDDVIGKEGIEAEKGDSREDRPYTDPNRSYGQSTDAYQNMGGYANTGQSPYGNPNQNQNNSPNQGGCQNFNQSGSAYGNGQYQQPNYNGNPNAGYQQGFGANPNTSYQQGYGSNSNSNYQSNYIGVPNAGYQQNYGNNPNSPYGGMDTSPMTMGDWLLTLLACLIPCAGIILSLIWAFGKNGNVNRRNFCRAQLIITGVIFVLYIIVILIWGVSFAGALSTY